MIRKLALALALTLAPVAAFGACTNPVVVKDGGNSNVSMSVATNPDGNCEPNVQINTLSLYNGSGSTTHSAATTNYNGVTTSQLFALNTSGNAVPTTVTVTGTTAGTGQITHAIATSSGTNSPPSIVLYLFSGAPTLTGLVDYSNYAGPYLADITSGNYIGSLSCGNWHPTNDGKFYSECMSSNGIFGPMPFKALNGATTINVVESIAGAYTPIASETHTYFFSTSPDR